MSTSIYLTDEDSEISGYKRATVGVKSDVPSIVQAITNTVTSPATQPQLIRNMITGGYIGPQTGAVLQWLTDPLKSFTTQVATWTLHLWANVDSNAANTGLEIKISRWTNSITATVIDDTGGPALVTTMQDYYRTTANASQISFNDGDRLAIQIFLNSVGGSVAGHTVQFDYNGLYAFADADTYLVTSDEIIPYGIDPPLRTVTKVRAYLKDTDAGNPNLTDIEIQQGIQSAINEHSTNRPRILTTYFAGDGTSYFYPLPKGWVRDWSELLRVEYPSGQQVPRELLRDKDWRISTIPAGIQPQWLLQFLTMTPVSAPIVPVTSGSSNLVMLVFTSRHYHNDLIDTLNLDDYEALCQLSASFCSLMMASKMAATRDDAMSADVVNYRDGTSRWQSVAKTYRERYQDHMGIPKNGVMAQGHQFDWDTDYSWRQDRLIHRRRLR